MLSGAVHAKTVNFFASHNYFGLDDSQIVFFDQSDFPCITPEGKIILESRDKVAIAPNGNGGLWLGMYLVYALADTLALKEQGHLDNMKKSGVKWVASYIIDNILAKVCDPLLLGFGIEKEYALSQFCSDSEKAGHSLQGCAQDLS